MAHFIKLSLEVVNLPQDVSKAGDFSVGGGNGGLGAGRLVERGALSLRCELGQYEQAIGEHETTKGTRQRSLRKGNSDKAAQIFLDGAVETYVIDSALDRSHQSLEVTAQHCQTSSIQQQPPASPLPRARRARCS